MALFKPKRLLWSPHADAPLFLVAAHDLRLYAWQDALGSPVLVSSITEPYVAHWKCLSWSPHPGFAALVAVGLSNGKVVVSTFASSNATSSEAAELSYILDFSPRHSRPCTAVEFCPCDHRLIAAGYEKVRNDYCLMVWDAEIDGRALGQEASVLKHRDRASSVDAGGQDSYSVSLPLLSAEHTMAAESVTDGQGHTRHISIVRKQQTLEDRMNFTTLNASRYGENDYSHPYQQPLWVTMNRSQTTSPLPYYTDTTNSSNIGGVTSYPSLSHTLSRAEETPRVPLYQFGSSETVSSVCWLPQTSTQLLVGAGFKWIRLYDLREDVGGSNTLTLTTKAVQGLTFDPYHPTRFASFSDDGVVKLWDLRKTSDPLLTVFAESPRTAAINQISFATSRANLLAVSYRDSSSVKIVYLQETRSARPQGNQSQQDNAGPSPNSPHVNGVHYSPQIPNTQQKDTVLASPISNNDVIVHRVRETTPVSSLSSFVWVPQMYMGRHRILSAVKSLSDPHIDLTELYDAALPVFSATNALTLARGPVLSVYSTPSIVERRQSVTSQAIHQKLSVQTISSQQQHQIQTTNPPSDFLTSDISRLMAKRAVDGYGLDAAVSHSVVADDEQLLSLWKWISDMETLAATNRTQTSGFDFNYHGILDVLQVSSPPLSMRGGSRSAQPQQTNNEASNDALTNTVGIFSTVYRSSQRSRALTMCGWVNTNEEFHAQVKSMQYQGQYERAAAWAFFRSDIELAIHILKSSGDEKLKLIATAMAGSAQASLRSDDDNRDGSPFRLYEESCRALSTELENPYLCVIFAYLSSHSWPKVLKDTRINLSARTVIALRFLNNDELHEYMRLMAKHLVHTGNLEGILFVGLTPAGVDLFSQYVDRSGDVQTASLALSLVVPRRFSDYRVEFWIESYRSYLDQLQLYHTRALFDTSRGKLMPSELNNVSPQIYVRCNFCNQSISQSVFIPGVKDKDGRRVAVNTSNMASMGRQKSTACPNCRKPLPRCALCLMYLGSSCQPRRSLLDGIATVPSPSPLLQHHAPAHLILPLQSPATPSPRTTGTTLFDAWFTWCQSCRHGGHSSHIAEWFQTHTQCPVANCDCRCNG